MRKARVQMSNYKIEIYPLDKVIHSSYNWALVNFRIALREFLSRYTAMHRLLRRQIIKCYGSL